MIIDSGRQAGGHLHLQVSKLAVTQKVSDPSAVLHENQPNLAASISDAGYDPLWLEGSLDPFQAAVEHYS